MFVLLSVYKFKILFSFLWKNEWIKMKKENPIVLSDFERSIMKKIVKNKVEPLGCIGQEDFSNKTKYETTIYFVFLPMGGG